MLNGRIREEHGIAQSLQGRSVPLLLSTCVFDFFHMPETYLLYLVYYSFYPLLHDSSFPALSRQHTLLHNVHWLLHHRCKSSTAAKSIHDMGWWWSDGEVKHDLCGGHSLHSRYDKQLHFNISSFPSSSPSLLLGVLMWKSDLLNKFALKLKYRNTACLNTVCSLQTQRDDFTQSIHA